MFRNRLRNSSLFLILIVLVFIIIPKQVSAQATEDPLQDALDLIVMIKTDTQIGAGIIFNMAEDKLYIATANHVVRRGDQSAKTIHVELRSHPDKFFPAKLEEHFDTQIDLAVILVEQAKAKEIYDMSRYNMNLLGKSESLDRGDKVFPVGHPNGVPWGVPLVPDRVAQVTGKKITFQSSFIAEGHSGGGLVDDSGVMVGMIVKDQPPFGLAISIEKITSTLVRWGYSLELNAPTTYNISGTWVGNEIFKNIQLKITGDNVSGQVTVHHPVHDKCNYDQNSIGRFPTTHCTYYENMNPENLGGTIKGNRIVLQASGKWMKYEYELRADQNARSSLKATTPVPVPYKILLNGKMVKGRILFSYKFEYPMFNEKSKGEFTAKRVEATEKKD